MTEPIVIIDVPAMASPQEASQALNAPGESYFLVAVLPVFGGHRAYLRRYKQTPTKADAVKQAATGVDDAVALSIVRANRKASIREIVYLLEKAGIARGRQWVSEQLTAIAPEDGREAEALKILKDFSFESDAEIVAMLRVCGKIKRGVAWVRQKREELANPVRADNS